MAQCYIADGASFGSVCTLIAFERMKGVALHGQAVNHLPVLQINTEKTLSSTSYNLKQYCRRMNMAGEEFTLPL